MRSSGQVPKQKGQAKAFISLELPSKSYKTTGLVVETVPTNQWTWTGTAKRTVLDMLSFLRDIRRMEALT